MASASSTPSSSTKALLLHCGAIQLSNPRTKEQTHDVLRYLSGQSKAKPIKRRSTIFKLEPELLLNLNPKPKVEEITLQEHVTDAVINRRIVSFDKVACQGGISRLGSHPASTGQLIRVHPLLSDGCSRHTHSTSLPASLHAMGFKTSPPELATIRECEEYTIPYSRHPCDITASIYTLYKLKPGHVDSEIDINAKSPAYEPVDRNFDAIELSAECDVAHVDIMASELQRIAARLQPVVSVSGCSLQDLLPLLPRRT